MDTPLLSSAATTDPYLDSFVTRYEGPGAPHGKDYFLQTSPEFAMKRLLAAGSGSIYQICKSFRNGEFGAHHNPEFTMLEWYRVGFDHHDLMGEVEALLTDLLGCRELERITYKDLFERYLGIDPHIASTVELQQLARTQNIEVDGLEEGDRDTWLSVLLTHKIEPKLGIKTPVFVYDYPASQAMLSKVRAGQPTVAERFELYIEGNEIANGFHELLDSEEQRRRFEQHIKDRQKLGLKEVPLDEALIAALDSGMPDCAGVALGLDRLLMLLSGSDSLSEVLTFPFDSV